MAEVQAFAAYLRPAGEIPPEPLNLEACEHIREQGVGPLLYRALRERHLLDTQLVGVRHQLARSSREEMLLEPFRQREVVRLLDALASAGVPVLVFKGTALAYTCYPEPSLRPRLDTDLLIRREDLRIASAVFEGLGCTRALRTSGEHVTHQVTYVSPMHGLQTAFDIHWKLSDPQPFADLFSFEELEREAISIPRLGPAAKTLCEAHALLVACVHRVAHHYDRDVLIYLYDIDLLARRLSDKGWDAVIATAATKRIGQVTLRGLETASYLLGTAVPDRVAQALSRSSDEPTAAYLAAGFRKIDILRADLRKLAWRDRFALLREHLFPPRAFVLLSYRQTSPALLPILYFVRIIRGARAWFRPLR